MKTTPYFCLCECDEKWSALYLKALNIATERHRGQCDKGGAPYIGHVMRVSQNCDTPEAAVVALLHDTIEDTGVTAEWLRAQGFPKRVVDAVVALTKREGETYEQFICRAGRNKLARSVKVADLEDNMDIRRLLDLPEEGVERLRRYLWAWHYLRRLGDR